MKRNVIEWAVLGISVLAIGALVITLVIEGLGETTPADPQVELRAADGYQAALGWVVPATVTNAGDQAVENVVLEAEATVDGEPETSELDIAFLPGGSSVDIAFSFSAQPEGEVTVRLVGYRLP